MATDPPTAQASQNSTMPNVPEEPRERRESISQRSENSQTAADFIRDQMQMEADAREALPYSIENCTKQLGSLRQNVFACLTCNPPPASSSEPFNAAGLCYSCSVQCHGEHELVEIFQKRNFTCDCGTTRFKPDQPCKLRVNAETNTNGGVHSEPADPDNKYNQNFRNRFCSCSVDYQPHEQKGTMFQCLGLDTHKKGCGEDWYHPGCLVGMGPKWYEKMNAKEPASAVTMTTADGALSSIAEDAPDEGVGQAANGAQVEEDDDSDAPLPDGFPGEDDFEHFLCYKCVEAYPWIKRYSGTSGFLPAVFFQQENGASPAVDRAASPRKRKLDDDEVDEEVPSQPKRIKSEQPEDVTTSSSSTLEQIKFKEEDTKESLLPAPESVCKLTTLPPAPSGQFSLFMTTGWRDKFCRCPDCFPNLKPHPQLLEEEDAYEPPLSDSASENGSTHGSGSLYERGESALRNVDRVRAIEGVMAYNHLKDQLKPFFQQFADSGKAIGADDIKEYFAKLRGDQEAIKEAGETAKDSENRQEQSGY